MFNKKSLTYLQNVFQNKNNITNEGFLIVKSDITRSQQLNLADALEKLRAIIRKAYAPVKVEPSQESIERQRRRYVIFSNSL